MIETRAQYVRTQIARWTFYNTLEELKAHPLTDPALDPKFEEVYIQSILCQIEELEVELRKYESRGFLPMYRGI